MKRAWLLPLLMAVASWVPMAASHAGATPPATELGSAKIWIGLKNSDAVGLRVDLVGEVFRNNVLIGSGELVNQTTGSSGFRNALLKEIPLDVLPVVIEPGDILTIRVLARRTCAGGGHAAGTVRLWYNGQPVDSGWTRDAGSRLDATTGGVPLNQYLRTSFELSETPGSSRTYVDALLDSKIPCPGRPFRVIGSWSSPHETIDYADLRFPPTLDHTISAVNRTANVYGQVWIDGVTDLPGPAPGLRAQLGFGPTGSDPATSPDWIWVDAAFNVDVGANDEFVASLLPEAVGTFDYAYRYSTTHGADWIYADLDGTLNGYSPPQAGRLTVNASSDTTAPATPIGLRVVSASTDAIELAWDAVLGDASLFGYELLRGDATGGPYALIARLTGTTYADTDVADGQTYYYVVRALDLSFNRSAPSSEVSATATTRTVTVIFNATVPASTDATGHSVFIAGTLDRVDGNLPPWDPGAVVLTRVDATHWTITLTAKEGTALEYKYTLGSWEHVEKGASCEELLNRQLTVAYGTSGTQTVNDTVANWRNVAPCGD